jgi:hypothetical protein
VMMGVSGVLADFVGRNIPLIFSGCTAGMTAVTVVLATGREFRNYLASAGNAEPAETARQEASYAR